MQLGCPLVDFDTVIVYLVSTVLVFITLACNLFSHLWCTYLLFLYPFVVSNCHMELSLSSESGRFLAIDELVLAVHGL